MNRKRITQQAENRGRSVIGFQAGVERTSGHPLHLAIAVAKTRASVRIRAGTSLTRNSLGRESKSFVRTTRSLEKLSAKTTQALQRRGNFGALGRCKRAVP
ncbi:hypothetical protein WN55_10718 [Dufourea novaeangliae]|uniref:Uncharacterized protein n=1 Tax=Dufourea novaeangliae TaxID=178035 RepID=A0A154P9T6_DUFNO|nr:hypothetical protein WN55_10718 [Dufourea novaeangliae]